MKLVRTKKANQNVKQMKINIDLTKNNKYLSTFDDNSYTYITKVTEMMDIISSKLSN